MEVSSPDGWSGQVPLPVGPPAPRGALFRCNACVGLGASFFRGFRVWGLGFRILGTSSLGGFRVKGWNFYFQWV